MAWYSQRFRRHLCDMHIDDWNEEFLSRFSPEDYFNKLQKANVQQAMIYLQSHLGYCNWPSKTAKVHKHFLNKPNDIKDLIDLCRSNNIAVVGYYSLNYNQWAHDQHPDWRMVDENGQSRRGTDKTVRAGLCCPNNLEYREFVYRQIDEILDFFTLDGIFFDMLFWPMVCYCKSCKEKYFKETGRQMPSINNSSSFEINTLLNARTRWMGEWALAVTEYVRSKNPNLTVEHNLSAAMSQNPLMGCGTLVNQASDYAGGDLYGGPFEQSFSCKVYSSLTNNQPFEYMTSCCTPNLLSHTVLKSPDELEQCVMITCAHHGANLLIDAIDPAGTMNDRTYELIGKVYAKEAVYEPYLKGRRIEDVGLLYTLDHKVNLQSMAGDSQEFLHFGQNSQNLTNHTATLQAMKTLVEQHIPVGVTTPRHCDSWKNYKVIAACNVNQLTDDQVDALIEYVSGGGNLYFDNCDEARLFETLIGGKYMGHTEVNRPYISPVKGYEYLMPNQDQKYPLPMNFPVPMVEGIDDKDVLAYICLTYTTRKESRCAAFHSDPPGVPTKWPALVEKRFGKGRVIWCAGSPELYTSQSHKAAFVNIIKRLAGSFSVYSNANKNIEIICYNHQNGVYVNAVNLLKDDELFEMPAFFVSVRVKNPVKRVVLLPGAAEVEFSQKEGLVTFEVADLKIFKMFEIQY